MKSSNCFLFVAALLLSSAFAAFGQTTASLTGTVVSDRAPLPGVTVTISSPSLQGTRTTVTGDAGGYSFPALPPGRYQVTFELEGMQTVTRSAELNLSTANKVDAEMRITGLTEAITVTAAAPAVMESIASSRSPEGPATTI